MKIFILLVLTLNLGYSQGILLFSHHSSVCRNIDTSLEKLNCPIKEESSIFNISNSYSIIKHTTDYQVSYYYSTNTNQIDTNENVLLELISDTGSQYEMYINYKRRYIACSMVPFNNTILYYYFNIIN